MDAMPLSPTYPDIALRLALTLLAGGLIGFNREVRGEKAGLRTTMLVALAAAVAMIQANLLLPVAGRTAASFSVMDVMRLPLGILSGMGFIGAGAILRRGELVIGITTAATLWTVTVIGLCFGGGQYGLGLEATVLALVIIWLLRALDNSFGHVQRATLQIAGAPGVDLHALAQEAFSGFRLTPMNVRFDADGAAAWFEVQWSDRNRERTPVAAMAALRARDGVRCVAWRAMSKRG
jgi:putative Mg2+ transporter-C (MgtC) family protein